ncbi:MAG: hypothetical protein JO257_15260, partial [Deltaproteobacteria bacterium]|nr:hypothetical protein [Deltaproteobacteria bacterium]
MSRSLGGLALVCVLSAPALAEPVRDQMFIETPAAPPVLTPAGSIPYNTLFINRCTGGCTVRAGTTDSRSDHSSLAGGTAVIQQFKGTDAQWQTIMGCIKDTFSVFNVNVTDVDPGAADHFEIMVAGYSSNLQNSQIGANTYGVSPYPCGGPYIPDALVFDFANQFIDNPNAFGNNSVEEEICATAAQEIAHAWTLDHVIIPADPMTYFQYTGRRYYTNGPAQCGSDCVGGRGPFGQTCTGNSHVCACSGQQTQNSVATITGLFGAGPGTPPIVTITNPKTGDNVSPGFPVGATATDDPAGVAKVELRIDGTLVDMLTRGPYAFNSPSTLGNGTHKVEVTAYDMQGTPGKATVEVVIGPPCQKPSDCSNSTDTCIGGRCVPGPGVQGGLGMPCGAGTDCSSGQCGNDGKNMYCVEQCTKGQCPSNFGCLETTPGSGMGVCWP